MRLNHIFYLLVVLLLVLCGLLLFYAGSDTKLFYCVEALVGLALVFLVIFYSRVVRPLRSIANGIDMLRGQDFSSRLIKVGQYEADLIIDVFNPMMEQLKNERLRLREQNTFLDLLLEASPMGVVATNMRGEVNMCNPSARAMLGCDPMGRMLAEIPGRLAARLAVMGPDSTETVRLNSADIYRCSRFKFMDKGCAHPFYLIETLTADVMAAEKEAYEKAIRMIVHEVNNTMGGVEATLDTMAMVCAGDDAVREVVDTTLDRTAQLRHFITRFAEAAKIPEPVPADTDVAGFVNANRNFLESLCTVHGVALRVDVSGVPFKAAIDVALMGQCLVNMVKNSVESIVSTGRQDGLVTVGIDGEKRTLTVCDNGAGITPEVEQRLFTPFYSTKRGGQGIGLIFISDILVRHGFRFSLFTDTGDSLTRFTIRL